MTLAGRTAPDIAAALRITTRTVQRDRVATGVAQPGPRAIPDDVLAAAERLLDEGCSYAEVSRTVAIDPTTTAKHFPGRGWTKAQTAEWSALHNRMRAAS